MRFSTRVEAMMTVPAGEASFSASNGAQASAYAGVLPGGDYFLSSLTSTSSLLETLQSYLNDNVQGYPQTPAATGAAIGYGDFTSGAAWAFDIASGNDTGLYGGVTMTANGTPTYQTAGPASAGDYAIGFAATSDYFAAGDVYDISGTDDFILAAVIRYDGTPAATRTAISKVSAAFADGWALRTNATDLVFQAKPTAGSSVSSSVAFAGMTVGSYYAVLAFVDRTGDMLQMGIQKLSDGTQTLGSSAPVGSNDFTTAASMRAGASAWTTTDTNLKIAYAAVTSGSGVAAGLNLSTALTNFANAINSQWTVALGSDGRVSIGWSGAPALDFDLTWTNTVLRDVLGFTSDITGATATQTGTKQARCVWYPDCPTFLPNSDPRLAPRGTDARTSVQQDGGRITFASGVSMRKHMGLRWSHVPLDRIREQSATYANASWRKFWDDTQLGLGGLSWCQPGSPLVIVDHNGAILGEDMQAGGPTNGWGVLDPGGVEPKRVDPNGYDGHWLVEIPLLVAQDS